MNIRKAQGRKQLMNLKQRLFLSGRTLCAFMTAGLVLAGAGHARAAGDCDNAFPGVVYVAGSSAIKPFIAKVAQELAALTPPITIVYAGPGSCVGVGYVVDPGANKLTGTAVSTWDSKGNESTTACGLSTDKIVDIGVSDVYADSCPGTNTLPSGVVDYHGPIQTMTFVVPYSGASGSTATAISAEQAYLVFGCGAELNGCGTGVSAVAPWDNSKYLEVRATSSGTLQMIAKYINVPAAKFKGNAQSGSGVVVSSLAADLSSGNGAKAIGILATDVADANRSNLRILAYQDYKQNCAYLPDSSPTSHDKANVRDGHYPIWGPLHMYSQSNGAKEATKTVLDYMTMKTAPTTFDMVALQAKGGVVPECAMHVTRSSDGAAMSSFLPEGACECKFLKEAEGAAPSSCIACTADNAATVCPAGRKACNYGYCEVK
jgi:ABC-type phosphate transport system substrate-binding protein